MSIPWRRMVCVGVAFGLWECLVVAAPVRVDLFSGVKNAIIGTDKAADGGRCVVADVSAPAGQMFLASSPELQPGVYEAALHVKVSTNNHINSAPLQWAFTVEGAGEARRSFDMLVIERPQAYQDISCRFVVSRAGKARVGLSWQRVSLRTDGPGVRIRVDKSEIPTVAQMSGLGEKEEDSDEMDLEAQLADEPPLEGLRYLYAAVDRVQLSMLSSVNLARVEVDKIRYNPGEKARVTVEVRNLSAAPRTLTLNTAFVQDLDTVIPLDERDLSLAAGAGQKVEIDGPVFEEPWGYALRCRVTENGTPVTEKSEYFTVHSNLWAVLIAGRAPAQFTAHVTRENAIAAAHANKRRYRNWVESGFWAPDEFGDFTPDTEYWWGGQGCYYGGVTGTKIQIEEGHKVGLSYAVYANIWGGDGPPAFEMMRAHPDWGYASSFDVEWFERWDRNTMGTGKPGRGMHVWPLCINNYENEDVFKHHGRELIGTHRMFGWDAVRYDSHAINDGNARVVDIVKKVVRAEVPQFQFGYNSSVPRGQASILKAFRAQCESEGGIMEEGIRQFGGGGMSFSGGSSYADFAKRILDFKEEARSNGGHFIAIGMDECYPNDMVYQYLFWLAGNTHPCYDWKDVSVADYMQFATRYAGQLWDLRVASVTNGLSWLDLGEAKDFLWMPDRYLHQRDLGQGRRQFIAHLINAPLAARLYTDDDNKMPPPRGPIPLSLRLPGKATVRGVWCLTAEPDLAQVKLPHEVRGGKVEFSVPRLRFWDVVVVDLDNAEAF